MTSAQTATNSRRHLYIGDKFEPQAGAGSINVFSASTEEVIGSVPEGTPEDVDRAVRAARAAFDSGWSKTRFRKGRSGYASWPVL